MIHLKRLFQKLLVISILFTIGCSNLFAQEYITGEVYYGRNDYTTYYAGDLPLIFSAPHGGNLTPSEIPNRTYGTTVTDSKTMDTALAIRTAVYNFTGRYPHVIICRLKRTKLDANREIVEAAQGNQWAEQAWYEYHGFIDIAKDSVTKKYGKGFYVDLHGHGHSIKRLELGYLLYGSTLMQADAQLNSEYYTNSSSLRTLAYETPVSFAELIRGATSLGTLMEDRGIPAVPSTLQPNPGNGNIYLSGGYSTRRHGSRDGGTISGVQIEAHYTGIRDNSTNRRKFAEKLTEALDIYLTEHFGWEGIVTDIPRQKPDIAADFMLEQNYPNPFNAQTIFKYNVPIAGMINLKVYNSIGQEVAILVNEQKTAGKYQVLFNASHLVSGLYFYQLKSSTFTDTKKFILIK